MYEAHLLKQIHVEPSRGAMCPPGCADAIGEMPRLVSVETIQGEEAGLINVRMAMTRVHGLALEETLVVCRDTMRDIPPGAFDRFAKACFLPQQMIMQLAPV